MVCKIVFTCPQGSTVPYISKIWTVSSTQPTVKERPEWMMYSTVHPSGDLVQEQSSSSSAAAAAAGLELAPGASKPAGNALMVCVTILMHET